MMPIRVSFAPIHFECLAGLGLFKGMLSVSQKTVRYTVDLPVSFVAELGCTVGGVFVVSVIWRYN